MFKFIPSSLLQITEQFNDVAKYSVTDDIHNPGEINVSLTASDGSTTEKSLKEISRQHPIASATLMGHVYQQMKEIYNESNSELATLELKSQKLLQQIADDLRYGPNILRGDVRNDDF